VPLSRGARRAAAAGFRRAHRPEREPESHPRERRPLLHAAPAGHTRVTVLDLAGRRVATLADWRVRGRAHHAEWATPGAPGVYMALLETNTGRAQPAVRGAGAMRRSTMSTRNARGLLFAALMAASLILPARAQTFAPSAPASPGDVEPGLAPLWDAGSARMPGHRARAAAVAPLAPFVTASLPEDAAWEGVGHARGSRRVPMEASNTTASCTSPARWAVAHSVASSRGTERTSRRRPISRVGPRDRRLERPARRRRAHR
jgi:hypothetical protein